jgi:hypothetical protein
MDLALARAVERTDYLRRSPFALGGPGGHKEWLHFCILADDLDLLVNFSLSDDVRAGAPAGAEHARLTVLVRGATWDGDVDGFEPAEVRVAGGLVDLDFGGNRCVFADGRYRLQVQLQERPVVIDAELVPRTVPALAPNIPLTDGPPLHWAVVPRLAASGRVVVGGREHRFVEAPAYHDHNWGHFLWGQDMAWEWGFALPDGGAKPWSLAFVRLTNRARTHALAQGIFLWRGRRQHRVFREHDVRFDPERAFLAPSAVFKIPRIMALLSPDVPTDVPRGSTLVAAADGDTLECVFAGDDLAQVVVPAEASPGVTVINEVRGTMRVRGRVGGEPVVLDGRGIFEFLGA